MITLRRAWCALRGWHRGDFSEQLGIAWCSTCGALVDPV